MKLSFIHINQYFIRLAYTLVFFLAVTSCQKEIFWEQNNKADNWKAGTGIFVLNEGNFTKGNSSLSFISAGYDSVSNNIFSKVNGRPLGDVGQSIRMIDENLWLIINNSGKIEIIDPDNMKSIKTLTGLNSPRDAIQVNDSIALISDLLSSKLQIINFKTFQYKGSIECGNSVEKMLLADSILFVLHWSEYGGYSNRSASIIDINRLLKTKEIILSKEPNSIVLDKQLNVWILCSGGWQGNEKPRLFCINPKNKETIRTIDFETGNSPSHLRINKTGDSLLFLNGSIYKMSIYDEQLPLKSFINKENRLLYAMEVDSQNGNIILSDALDYSKNGVVYIYNRSGKLLSKLEAGIIPGSFFFYHPVKN